DPVAVDQACVDLVNAAEGLKDSALASGHEPGGDKFRGVHPDLDGQIALEHAEKIGLGSRDYELVRLEPLGKKW
ncbi:MAG: 4Fe-4S ferredoxin, partial [Desulfuromonadales bacterium]|nr:4Fe-4S ferredoxin [Desulfuromonadales bacterium]NIR33582.1 4Fe-4S ferredoxin [Desulfuromonadales bacterium]NIS39723.1 4Fe-4S ferredoxin [Desulfuromonadales bacterium]